MLNDHIESLISRNIPISDPFHPPVSQIPTPQRRTLARPPWLQGWNLMNGETNGRPMGRLMWSLVMAGHGKPTTMSGNMFLNQPPHDHEQSTNSCAIFKWKVALWNRASNGNFQMIQNIQGRILQSKKQKKKVVLTSISSYFYMVLSWTCSTPFAALQLMPCQASLVHPSSSQGKPGTGRVSSDATYSLAPG